MALDGPVSAKMLYGQTLPMCVHVCVCVCVCDCECACVHAYACIYIYMYVCMYIYIHLYFIIYWVNNFFFFTGVIMSVPVVNCCVTIYTFHMSVSL